jgi:hypothetical protein
MAIIKVSVCSNCHREDCDGQTYKVKAWEPNSRLVCKGSDGESIMMHEGKLKYDVVVGHGHSYFSELIKT